jgi:stage V sporulation protein AC
MPIFSIGCLCVPENLYWLSFILLPLFYIFLLYLGWKSRICKDTIIEPVKKSRLQSVLIWIGFALIVWAFAEIGISRCKINYFLRFNIDYFLLILLLIAAILTAFGCFDRIARFAGAGTLVPVTGFSNAVVSEAMDSRSEGYILGVGSKIYTVAGPVILYGIFSGALYGVVYYLVRLFTA